MKDVLVHVNVSKHCLGRLRIAVELVRSFDAHLTGLFTSAKDDVPFFMMEELNSKVEPTMSGWWTQMRDQVRADFESLCSGAGIPVDWREVSKDIGSQLPYHARYADLTVVGQSDPEELLPRPEYEVPERVALESGRPVLIVPYAGEFPSIGKRILVAWNGSPQSARAVNDALPFLKRAEAVTVLTINAGKLRIGGEDQPGPHIVSHLSRYGIEAQARNLAVDDVGAGDLILSQASDEGTDLIVMGAYGRTRARETILGGATRSLFRHMTVPVLMSH